MLGKLQTGKYRMQAPSSGYQCLSEFIILGVKIMSNTQTNKIHVRNSVKECAQSLRKENAGKFQNYGIRDCIASIAASKRQ